MKHVEFKVDPRFEIRKVFGGWSVYCDGHRLTLPAVTPKGAQRAHDRIAGLPPGSVRPCITCQRIFVSEGIHNRMCEECRSATWGV